MGNFGWFETIKLLPVYVLFISTFGLTSLEKFRSGGCPDWFKAQFEKTFIKHLPGGFAANYYFIAVLEAAVAVLFLVSAGSLEFLPGHDISFLKAALLLALFTFCALGFGARLSGDYQGAANLFGYFGVTFLILLYVEQFLHHSM